MLFLPHTRTCSFSSLIAVCLIYSTGFKLRGNSAVGEVVMDLKAILRLSCAGSLDSLFFFLFFFKLTENTVSPEQQQQYCLAPGSGSLVCGCLPAPAALSGHGVLPATPWDGDTGPHGHPCASPESAIARKRFSSPVLLEKQAFCLPRRAKISLFQPGFSSCESSVQSWCVCSPLSTPCCAQFVATTGKGTPYRNAATLLLRISVTSKLAAS